MKGSRCARVELQSPFAATGSTWIWYAVEMLVVATDRVKRNIQNGPPSVGRLSMSTANSVAPSLAVIAVIMAETLCALGSAIARYAAPSGLLKFCTASPSCPVTKVVACCAKAMLASRGTNVMKCIITEDSIMVEYSILKWAMNGLSAEKGNEQYIQLQILGQSVVAVRQMTRHSDRSYHIHIHLFDRG